MSDFKAAVGLSRKWDAREAGREVARDALDRLGMKPKFVVLACTYEYFKNGGYEELLNGVWEVLPEETELIGGVIGGFIIRRGCFNRGATILAVSGNMDVASAVAKNTKGNPRKAGRKAGKAVREQLVNSKYRHGFAIDFTSGPLLPKMPIIGQRKVSDSKLLGWFISLLLPVMGRFSWGIGREDEVRKEFTHVLSDFKAIGISTWDNAHYEYHREFHNKKIYNNAIIALGFKSNFDAYVKTGLGFHKTEKKFMVTKMDKTGTVIKKINGKPAREEYLRILGWRPGVINEHHMKRSLFIMPSFEKNGTLYPEITSMFFGDYIIVGRRIENPEMTMLTASGKSLIGAVDEAMEGFSGKPLFALISECAARQEALGSQMFMEKEKIEKYLGDAPYFALFSGGECTYTPEQGCRHKHESFNVAIFKEEK